MRPTINLQDFLLLKDSPDQALRFLVCFGTLAPSSHNSQPWLFRIRENVIEVRGNEKRALPASDANHRQLFVSVGCAIENILVACDYYGLPVHIAYFPEPSEPFLVARIRVERLVVQRDELPADHLALHIQTRHNNRSSFDKTVVPDEFMKQVILLGGGVRVDIVNDQNRREALAVIIADATEAAFHDHGFTEELSRWIKPSFPAYPDGMPGYNIGVPWPVSFIVPLAIRYGNVAKQQRRMIEDMLRDTQTFLILSTKTDELRDFVLAGQKLEQMWLMADAAGLKLGVLAAGIQIGDFYKRMQDVLGITERPQVFCRLGYATKIPKQSPRLNVEEVFIR